ncbi:TolC family outer membrane protein [Aestuariivirga litoralis]|uniref:TolC family outer membrane protein n=1 Tax=Aestuariivirga litoralis TaxID=2650924 RepID=UPI0018C78E7C|nr:TolC family outer membrane protein [Aestuariivirga litoralis]MBG1231337.1 TolC family outer membrane protein [Aestuariivirga litoralis]
MSTSFVSLVHAESLAGALLEAYRKNPTLNSARAGQRAVDEAVPQALSGWRPTVTATGSVSAEDSYAGSQLGGYTSTKGTSENLSIKLDQPLFRGFRTTESTAAAEATVKAGRQQLLSTEQNVLLLAVKAYVDVIRDRQIVALRRQNLGVLQGQSRATSERFKAGELTRTDTAQAQAGVASAQAQLQLAIANMQTSEASFAQYVGHHPTQLSPAPAAKPPRSLDEAYSVAHETNPQILAAAQSAVAADHNVGVVGSSLLPQADLVGSYSITSNQFTTNGLGNDGSASTGTISGVVTVPIYEQGLVYSQVRAAKQRASQSRIAVIDATRQVRQAVAASWASYAAARQASASNAQSVSASQLAYSGVRQEYQVGSRSTIDVLNAELTLLTAQIAQVSAQHDQILASYQLQAAIGHLTGDHLRLFPVYDAKQNYEEVRNKWAGTKADTLQ